MQEQIIGPSFFIGKGTETGDLISFGSGQPDLPPPPSAFSILESFRGFKYGLVQGEETLRAAIAKEYPSATPDEVVVTNGASEAIDLVLRAIAEPGARVALPRPYYYSYPHNVTLAGMTPVYYDLDKGKIDFERFEKAIQDCRAVMINSPSNPTGTVQDIDTLKKVEDLCNSLGIYILSDEVYKDLIYVRENYPLKGKRVIAINSFSKTYAMCGLRLGYFHTLDRKLVEDVVEMKSHTSMNTSIASQAMGLAAMSERATYVASHVPIWEKRRDIMYTGLRDLGLDVWKPEGAFYVLPKIKNSTRAMHDLYANYQLITYDGTWFGAPDRLRFSYALDAQKIEEGLRRLKKFLETEYTAY
ncbi:MAG TPA: aminotransferase class I/II-fold pyridoxal phosphate-dependent enzyme [Candidatus Paceibacterota bacterium]